MCSGIAIGVAWVGVATVFARIARYAALLILASILTPAEMGLFAAVYVFIDGLSLFQGFGIGHALIYRKDRFIEAADTAFYLSVSISLVFAGLAFFLAPSVEWFLGEQGVSTLFVACIPILILQALRLVPFRLFEKTLDFKKKLFPSFLGSTTYLATAVYLAYRGAGVWSMVAGELASLLVETLVYWYISPWKPGLHFNRSIAGEIFRFGRTVLGGTLLVYLFANIDRAFISRILGVHHLGFYALAYSLANLPATVVVRALNTVLLPSYSSLHENRERQKSLFLKANSYVGSFGILYLVGIVAFGRYFLLSAYGEKWLGAVLALKIMAIFGLLRALNGLVGDLLVGIGRPDRFRMVNLVQILAALPFLYFGATRFGAAGVAAVMTLSRAIALITGWYFVHQSLETSPRSYLRTLQGPLLAGLVTALISLYLLRGLDESGSLGALGIAVTVVCTCYCACLLLFDRELRLDFRNYSRALRERFREERSKG